MNKLGRNLLAIPLLCLSCGMVITAVHALLSPRIDAQQSKTAEAIYFDALNLQPGAAQLDSSRITDDTALLGLRTLQRIYIARQANQIVGVVLPLTARKGYGGDIDLLLGVDTNGKVISVRVVSQHETRDLGDKIEYSKSNWLDQFHDAALDKVQKNRWQLRSEGGTFDGMTGATVTSRAVVKSVQQGLDYFAEHRDELLGAQKNE